jgi:non-homologous end joining protein Ku
LIDRYAGSFDIDKYEDTYRESLLKVIKAKQRGRDVHAGTADTDESEKPPSDLLEALRQSVAQHSGNGKSRPTRGDGELAHMTKGELVKRAKKRRVDGYSAMNKKELVAALE